MAKFKKLTVLLSAVIVIIGAFMPAVIACDMDTKFIRKSSTMWSYDSNGNHLGKTSIAIKYTNMSSTVLSQFKTKYIPSARTAWNNAVEDYSLSLSTSSTSNFVIAGDTANTTGYVVNCTTSPTQGSSGTMTGYTLTLYENTIGALNTVQRTRAAYQVVGFMYGLRRISSSTVNMSSSFHNVDISANDVIGMHVMTHKHKHNASNVTLPDGTTSTSRYSHTYNSTSNHKISCSYCNTYFYQTHSCSYYQHNEQYHRISCGKCTTYQAHLLVNNVCKYCSYAANLV